MKCTQCGAVLDPGALSCPFCGLVTPAGAAARQRAEHEAHARAQWAAAAQYQQGVAARTRMDGTATQSLVFGLAGLVLCCTPMSIVGIVQGARARSMASEIRAPAPTKATIGLVLSILSTVTSIVFLTYAIIAGQQDAEAGKERVAALEKQLGDRPARATLDHDTACKLAQVHAMKNGWHGTSGYYLEGFECVGRLTASSDRAELEDFAFANNGSRYRLSVCFKHGARWYVGEMREGRCDSQIE